MKNISKCLTLSIFTFLLMNCKTDTTTTTTVTPTSSATKNFFDFTVTDIDGNQYALSNLKGKKILVVNTASNCGYTPQYTQLEELQNTYKNNNFTVIGFPANDFAGQEPGSNTEIKTFCTANYGVTFPMMAKIAVTGESIAPIYQFLTQKATNGLGTDMPILWNFQKFMINKDGSVHAGAPSATSPLDNSITNWIIN